MIPESEFLDPSFESGSLVSLSQQHKVPVGVRFLQAGEAGQQTIESLLWMQTAHAEQDLSLIHI